MSLPAVVQHLQVLEQSGLVTTKKIGQGAHLHHRHRGAEPGREWLNERRLAWNRRLDRLDVMFASGEDER